MSTVKFSIISGPDWTGILDRVDGRVALGQIVEVSAIETDNTRIVIDSEKIVLVIAKDDIRGVEDERLHISRVGVLDRGQAEQINRLDRIDRKLICFGIWLGIGNGHRREIILTRDRDLDLEFVADVLAGLHCEGNQIVFSELALRP